MTTMPQSKDIIESQMERRLTWRVLKRWQEACGEGAMPRFDQLSPEAFNEDWDFCFVIDACADHPFPIFKYLGPEIAKYSGVFLSGKSDWTKTLLDKSTSHLQEVLDTRETVLVEDELFRFDGKRILFRCILLPLSKDGTEISEILGAASGKLAD